MAHMSLACLLENGEYSDGRYISIFIKLDTPIEPPQCMCESRVRHPQDGHINHHQIFRFIFLFFWGYYKYIYIYICACVLTYLHPKNILNSHLNICIQAE